MLPPTGRARAQNHCFEPMTEAEGLPEYVERYIEDILGVTLTRK